MNEDKIKSQTVKPIAGNAIPTSEEHPLHILDNQTDPTKKPRKFDVPQKPIRTFEKDLQEEMARVSASGVKIKEPKKSFFSFLSKKSAFENKTTPATATPTTPTSNTKIATFKKEQEKPKADSVPTKNVATKNVPVKSIPVKTDSNVLEEDIIVDIPKVAESPGFLARQMKEQSSKLDEEIFDMKSIPEEKVGENKIEKVEETNKIEVKDEVEVKDKKEVKEVKVFVKPQVIEEPKVVVEPKPVKTFEEALAEAQSHIKRFDSQNKTEEPPKVFRPIPSTPNPIKPQPQENIRTYEGDVADTIKTKKTSVLTMALAENERGGGNSAISNIPESHNGKNISMALASIALIAGGIYGGYYLYSISPLAVVPIVKENRLPSIISADTQKIVTAPSTSRADFLKFISNQFKSTNTAPNKVTELVINQIVASTSVRFTGKDFVNVMDFEMTDTLKRALTEKWMVGLSSVEEQGTQYNFPFIILTTDFFQNAFSGMLKWENAMPNDLSGILSFEDTRGSFQDKVIMNRDIREFVGTRGEVVFLYTFIDKDTILITTSEAVVPIILDRIEKQTYVR